MLKDNELKIKDEESENLRKQLNLKDKELENTTINKEKELLQKHHKKRCLYVIQLPDGLIKFGITINLQKRLSTHKSEISPKIAEALNTIYPDRKSKKPYKLSTDKL
jgi:hypothetical protein